MLDKEFKEKYYEFKNDIAEDYLSSEFETSYNDYDLMVWYEYRESNIIVQFVDTDEYGNYGTLADMLTVKEFMNMTIDEFANYLNQVLFYGTFEYDD